jgi:cell division protein FtsN
MNTPKINKRGVETVKTVVIAVLITAIIAFIGGMHFANQRNAEVKQAVSAAQTAVAPTVSASAAPASK